MISSFFLINPLESIHILAASTKFWCIFCVESMIVWCLYVVFGMKRTITKHHILSIVGELECPTCFKTFSRRDALNIHIRDIHQNAGKLFFCDICSKSSKTLQGLKMHMSNYHRDHKKQTQYLANS